MALHPFPHQKEALFDILSSFTSKEDSHTTLIQDLFNSCIGDCRKGFDMISALLIVSKLPSFPEIRDPNLLISAAFWCYQVLHHECTSLDVIPLGISSTNKVTLVTHLIGTIHTIQSTFPDEKSLLSAVLGSRALLSASQLLCSYATAFLPKILSLLFKLLVDSLSHCSEVQQIKLSIYCDAVTFLLTFIDVSSSQSNSPSLLDDSDQPSFSKGSLVIASLFTETFKLFHLHPSDVLKLLKFLMSHDSSLLSLLPLPSLVSFFVASNDGAKLLTDLSLSVYSFDDPQLMSSEYFVQNFDAFLKWLKSLNFWLQFRHASGPCLHVLGLLEHFFTTKFSLIYSPDLVLNQSAVQLLTEITISLISLANDSICSPQASAACARILGSIPLNLSHFSRQDIQRTSIVPAMSTSSATDSGTLLHRIVSDFILPSFLSTSHGDRVLYVLQCLAQDFDPVTSPGCDEIEVQVLTLFKKTRYSYFPPTSSCTNECILVTDPSVTAQQFLSHLTIKMIKFTRESSTAKIYHQLLAILLEFPNLAKFLLPQVCTVAFQDSKEAPNSFCLEVNSLLQLRSSQWNFVTEIIPVLLVVIEQIMYDAVKSLRSTKRTSPRTQQRANQSASPDVICPLSTDSKVLIAKVGSVPYKILTSLDLVSLAECAFKLGLKDKAAIIIDFYSKLHPLTPSLFPLCSSLSSAHYGLAPVYNNVETSLDNLGSWLKVDGVVKKLSSDDSRDVASIKSTVDDALRSCVPNLLSNFPDSMTDAITTMAGIIDVEQFYIHSLQVTNTTDFSKILTSRRKFSLCKENRSSFITLSTHSLLLKNRSDELLSTACKCLISTGDSSSVIELTERIKPSVSEYFATLIQKAIAFNILEHFSDSYKLLTLLSNRQIDPSDVNTHLFSLALTSCSTSLGFTSRARNTFLIYDDCLDDFYHKFVEQREVFVPSPDSQFPIMASVAFKYARFLDRLFTVQYETVSNRDNDQASSFDGDKASSKLQDPPRFFVPEDPQIDFQHLFTCLKYYGISALIQSDLGKEGLFRAVLLYLTSSSRFEAKTVVKMSSIIQNLIQVIPAKTWVPLLSQFVARLELTSQPNHSKIAPVIKLVVQKVAQSCPKLAVWILAPYYLKVVASGGSDLDLYHTLANTPDIKIIESLFKDIHGVALYTNKRTLNDCRLSDVRGCRLGEHLKKMCAPIMRNFSFCDNLLMIADVKNDIKIFKSLARPIALTVILDDGSSQSLLIKPGDDLRLDARVIDTIVAVNDLLKRRERSGRDLAVVPFAVTPLRTGFSAKADPGNLGIIEMIPRVSTIRSELHKLYVKYEGHTGDESDWFGAAMQLVRQNREPLERKYGPDSPIFKKFLLEYFENNLLVRFKPVFHRFFIDSFATFEAVVASKRLFSSSTAVWCGLGYCLGLGDRHLENILIDDNGRVHHCDFNYVFNKGRGTRVPEIVPFRMTQNIVDGTGPFGIDNIIRPIILKRTLQCVREHMDFIYTIMKIFMTDPLLEWNNEVSRHLERFSRRLKFERAGVELHVEELTNQLLEEAMSRERLCQLYGGWTPFL
ncbi:hypothetical protein RCL1_008308 [Eukaryota sp. TZLM3-RCL]